MACRGPKYYSAQSIMATDESSRNSAKHKHFARVAVRTLPILQQRVVCEDCVRGGVCSRPPTSPCWPHSPENTFVSCQRRTAILAQSEKQSHFLHLQVARCLFAGTSSWQGMHLVSVAM